MSIGLLLILLLGVASLSFPTHVLFGIERESGGSRPHVVRVLFGHMGEFEDFHLASGGPLILDVGEPTAVLVRFHEWVGHDVDICPAAGSHSLNC